MDRRLAASVLLTAIVLLVAFSLVFSPDGGAAPPADDATVTPTTSADLPADTQPLRFGRRDVRRHFGRLATTDYAIVTHRRNSNGTATTYRVRSSLGSERLYARLDSGNRSVTQYIENRTLYRRTVENGTTSYDRQSLSLGTRGFATVHRQSSVAGVLQLLPSLGNYTRAANVTRNGTRFQRYTLSNLTANRQAGTTVTNSSAVVLVSERDVIRHASVATAGTRNGTAFTGRFTYDVRAVGSVSVERPAWVTADGDLRTDTG